MSDKELADKLDAEDRLRARGYRKVPCRICKGMGAVRRGAYPEYPCHHCDNKGYTWEGQFYR